jgi:hypothetical protein
MMGDLSTSSLRNALAILAGIDPIELFPEHHQSEQRIAFRGDRLTAFLTADDAVQEQITGIINRRRLEILQLTGLPRIAVITSL